MTQQFNDNPILNSPYKKPEKHWKLDAGKPTGDISHRRRPSSYLVPIHEAERTRRRESDQADLELENKTTDNPIINLIRQQVDEWRMKPPERWNITYESKQLLTHWREGKANPRPFFCQVEAVETLIWLNEVAPNTAEGRKILDELKDANEEANPNLLRHTPRGVEGLRYASKMATGSGKTTVMAMMIAYHTINKFRHPNMPRFSNHFLIITPGITIKDRLRVLLPSDPQEMYVGGGIVPPQYSKEIQTAQIVITNYHAFRMREKLQLSKGAREILKGNDEAELTTRETPGQMLERACKSLLGGKKDVIVINDEAHHCYRHKPIGDGDTLSAEEKAETKKHTEAARLWISGIEHLAERANLKCIYDLSATPFFLKGSGYQEGELFPWVVSDFALMDAIECGIVKLPRVPIDDKTITPDNLPIYRNIYQRVKKYLPRKGRSKQGSMNPDDLPAELQGALTALYGHYEETHKVWLENGVKVPPVFIIVCNNTSTSKLVHDYVAGYELPNHPGVWKRGKFDLFSNVDRDGKPLPRMSTLLIDSEQLDSGEAMSDDFKKAAAVEIDRFKSEMRDRFPERDTAKFTDEDLLREVMNTVGKEGHLGEQIRCVVSVSMLTEGWDARSVTHILGVRAFGTQLLCEQVVGRGLRRQSYEINKDGLFDVEYADVFGVPFTFATGSRVGPPPPPKPQYRVHAVPERKDLTITFPRVRSYTVKIPDEKLVANFTEDSRLTLTPEDAPPITEQQGIIGKGATLTLDQLQKHRMNEVVFNLAAETVKQFADDEENIAPKRFRDLIPITRHWLNDYLTCLGGTFPQYILWKPIAVKAAEKIHRACSVQNPEAHPKIQIPVIDSFNPKGSSAYVDFFTKKERRYSTSPNKCHVNLAVCDSDWEVNFCALLEGDAGVHAYIRNDGLGFEVPYIYQKKAHLYQPDFIALINDGHGEDDLLNLVIEIKGLRDDKDRTKADTMNRYWIPSVNNDGRFGRWAFVEIDDMEQARVVLAQFTTHAKMHQATE